METVTPLSESGRDPVRPALSDAGSVTTWQLSPVTAAIL